MIGIPIKQLSCKKLRWVGEAKRFVAWPPGCSPRHVRQPLSECTCCMAHANPLLSSPAGCRRVVGEKGRGGCNDNGWRRCMARAGELPKTQAKTHQRPQLPTCHLPVSPRHTLSSLCACLCQISGSLCLHPAPHSLRTSLTSAAGSVQDGARRPAVPLYRQRAVEHPAPDQVRPPPLGLRPHICQRLMQEML